MAVEYKRIFKDWFKVGAIYGLVATALSLFIGWLKVPLVNVTFSAYDVNVRQAVVQGASTDLGAKISGFLSGLLPFSMGTFIVALISAVLTVYIGKIIFEWLPFKARTPIGKLTQVIFLGTIVSGIIAAFALSIPAVGLMIASLIYAAVVSTLIWLLSTKANLFKIPE